MAQKSEKTAPPKSTEPGSKNTLETRTIDVDPRTLKLLTENARFMPPAEFKLLVDNVTKDGALTSSPLVASDENGKLEVLSGNHRTQAAIAAGLDTIPVIEITTSLSKQQRVAMQLSHNSITGQDDPNVLKTLYDTLDLDFKQYSGLTDEDFDIKDLDIDALALGAPTYEEINLTFLPKDKQLFLDLLERVGKSKPTTTHLLTDLDDFGRMFDAIIAVKAHSNVHNAAIAFRIMTELALERIEQLTAEEKANNDEVES